MNILVKKNWRLSGMVVYAWTAKNVHIRIAHSGRADKFLSEKSVVEEKNGSQNNSRFTVFVQNIALRTIQSSR
jgi:hypothetical protein